MAIPGYGSVGTSIDRSRRSATTRSDDAPIVNVEAHVAEAGEQVLHVLGPGADHVELAAGDGDGGEVGGGLDAVGHRAVVDRSQGAALDALDRRCATSRCR